MRSVLKFLTSIVFVMDVVIAHVNIEVNSKITWFMCLLVAWIILGITTWQYEVKERRRKVPRDIIKQYESQVYDKYILEKSFSDGIQVIIFIFLFIATMVYWTIRALVGL